MIRSNTTMPKARKYCVVHACDDLTLEGAVNELIEEGWQPVGGMAATYDSACDEQHLWQAMVMYSSTSKEGL